MEDQSLTRDQARAWFKDVVFEKGKPASPMPALYNDNGLIYNKSARKCIDKCQENEYSLFTYKKLSDEIYSVPHVQVPEEQAFAWLRSDG